MWRRSWPGCSARAWVGSIPSSHGDSLARLVLKGPSFAPTRSVTSIAPGAGDKGDAYAELLRNTRGLRREQAQQREGWFAQVAVDRKDELLFELEILLKGLACFANPRNHPGPTRRTPVVAQD